MGISSSAVLVELNVSVWGATKIDKVVTDEVINDNGAVRNAAKVHKNLTAGSSLRKDVSDYAAKVRQMHNAMTLPWATKGARLLPTKMVLEYKQNMNQMELTFNTLLLRFYSEYTNVIFAAEQNLGSMFNVGDYPSIDNVKSKFGWKLVFSPLPEAGDFRIDVANDELQDLTLSYKADYEERLGNAMREPWERLHEMLQGMSHKLVEVEGETESRKRYHDSFVSNAQGLCNLLTKMNITNDPKLEEARRALELTMVNVDIEGIKESPEVRSSVKSKVDEILKRFDW